MVRRITKASDRETTDMDIELIREAAHARPFRKFWLCLKDGTTIPVAHYDFLAFSPSKRSISVSADKPYLLSVGSILRIEMDPGTEIDPKVNAIREALQATPFRPFVVRLSDGRKYPVSESRYAHVSPGGRHVLIFRPDDDTMSVLEPPFLREIELLDLPVSATGTAT